MYLCIDSTTKWGVLYVDPAATIAYNLLVAGEEKRWLLLANETIVALLEASKCYSI
jgi:hypothetical protein